MTKAKKRLLNTAVLLGVGVLACVGIWESLLEMNDKARRASCQAILWQWEAREYAAKNDGLFPPLSPVAGRLTFDAAAQAYRFTVDAHVCEYDREGPPQSALRKTNKPAVVDDWSYAYLGYFIENDEQAEAFLEAYRIAIAEDRSFEGDLKVPPGKGNCGGDTLYRLRTPESLPPEAACLRERAQRIPVVIEWPGNHRHMGGHVVFLGADRQVYMEYPGEFPMTPRFLGALRAIDGLGERVE